MFRAKLIISIMVFVTLLIITSIIKNKTRIIEKQILKTNKEILLKKKILMRHNLIFTI